MAQPRLDPVLLEDQWDQLLPFQPTMSVPRTRVNAIRGLAPAKYRTQRMPVRVNSTRRGTDILHGSIGAVLLPMVYRFSSNVKARVITEFCDDQQGRPRVSGGPVAFSESSD